MAEYIKRVDAMRICQSYSQHCFETNDSNGQDIADRIETDIVEIPTANVEENVVFCSQCKYLNCHSAIDRSFFCRNPYGMLGSINVIEERHYCSRGERRDKSE